jgi:uncharacterized protein
VTGATGCVETLKGSKTERNGTMKSMDVIAAVLLVIGGVNWGLVGLLGFDLVAWITGAGVFGAQNALGTLVYVLVGLAAIYQAAALRSIQRRWGVRTV